MKIRHDTLLFDLRVHFLHRNYFFGRVGIQRHRGSETTVQGGVIMHFILQRTATDHAESSIARRPEVVLMT